MVTANVDFPALRARHDLGDTVEAAGVRLRGRGRVRQGVCPFHEETEGSFTVYEDSQKFWCFGCGERGDVLDFVRKSEGLSLPRGHRAPGRQPRACAPVCSSSSPDAASCLRRAAAEGPIPADGGGALLRRLSPAFPRSEGVPDLAGRRPRRRRPPRLSATAPGGGLRQALESLGFSEKRIRDSGLFMERGSERFAGMVVVPDAFGGLVRWLKGRALDSGSRNPGSRPFPTPSKPVLGLGRLGPTLRPGRSSRRASSTGSSLPAGAFPPALPWALRALTASPRPSGVAHGSSSPSTTTTRAARRRTGF